MTATMQDYAIKPGLPKKTSSVCPECGKILEATLYEKDGKVYMDKECPQHNKFTDIYWSDVNLYLKAEKYAHDGVGLQNTMDKNLKEGENVHVFIDNQKIEMLTCTALANIDLTNRCNMNCPICFANANQQGYVYEPDYDTLVNMLVALRSETPIKCTAVQFSGGEPTIHPSFIKIIEKARELKFAQIQVATNGLEFARNYEKFKAASLAGLNTIYLSFDGISDNIYLQSTGRKMFQVKLDVLNNCRKIKEETGKCPSVVLVPTVVKGINDCQIGDMVRFALDNSDIIRGINFQPVAFTGRIEKEDLDKGRFTLPDLAKAFEEQVGAVTMDDWYPVSVVAPISNFASIILGENKVTFTTHPHCGIATYIFVDDKDNIIPFPKFIDIDTFSEGLIELSKKAENAMFKKLTAIKLLKLLNKSILEENMPEGMNKKKFVRMIKNVMSNKSKETLSEFSWKMMFFGAMHFQDSYNYDIERVKRCGVHYITPDCQIIPFCAYNGGPEYRAEVEKKFSVPISEWKEKNKKEAKELEDALIVPDDPKVS